MQQLLLKHYRIATHSKSECSGAFQSHGKRAQRERRAGLSLQTSRKTGAGHCHPLVDNGTGVP